MKKISAGASLFLDRDGVINERLRDDYVKSPAEFQFCKGTTEALKGLSDIFPRIFIVTNQQGVSKGIMSAAALEEVHAFMLLEIQKSGGRITRIYSCTDTADSGSIRRKPAIGMGLDAKKDYPEISFEASYMAGDAPSDMEFGKALGMTTVFILTPEYPEPPVNADLAYDSLLAFYQDLIQ